MSISEVPLATLNRYAAERIEPKHMHSAASWRHVFRTGTFEPIDFTQPAGMKMLLERFPYEKLFIVIGPTSACDKWGKHLHVTDVGKLGRALLEGFCEAHGFQVEEA